MKFNYETCMGHLEKSMRSVWLEKGEQRESNLRCLSIKG